MPAGGSLYLAGIIRIAKDRWLVLAFENSFRRWSLRKFFSQGSSAHLFCLFANWVTFSD